MHKKKEPKKIYVASSRRVMLVLMSLSTIPIHVLQPVFQLVGHAAGIRRSHVHERAHGGRFCTHLSQ